jgi:hypothetical protein
LLGSRRTVPFTVPSNSDSSAQELTYPVALKGWSMMTSRVLATPLLWTSQNKYVPSVGVVKLCEEQ